VENWRFGDSPHDERNDESEGRNGRLDGSGVGEVGVAEIKQEQQLAAEDAAYQTLKPINGQILRDSIWLQCPLRPSD
jgi:hypothetical protein